MDEVLGLLPPTAKTRRLAAMILPHLLEELSDVPEETVNQATSFILMALARVHDPNARQVLVDVEGRSVQPAEFVPGGGANVRYFAVTGDASTLPALPESIADSGDGNRSAPTTA